jgi:hypothetical protein
MVGMQADMPSARCASSHNREDNPMTELKTVDVYVVMDSDGDHVASEEMDHATERYNDCYGAISPLRIVKITVTMRPPEITEASVTIPDVAGQQVTAAAE